MPSNTTAPAAGFSCRTPDAGGASRFRVVKPHAKGGLGETFLAEDLYTEGRPPCVVEHFKPHASDEETLRVVLDENGNAAL